MITEILLAFGTIFPIVNPFSTALVFNKLSQGFSADDKMFVALKSSFYAAVTMIIFMLLGKPMLSFFGITIYSFRVAGGLYLAKIGFDMLNPKPRRDPDRYKEKRSEIAMIPLAIPLLSGPGALTSVLVMANQFTYVAVIAAILMVCLISYVVLRHAHFIEKFLGHTGSNVLERILGLIVLVVAVQFVFNGITGYLVTI